MRKRFELQLTLGQTAIELIKIPTKSRDELPPVLAGLQWIFITPEINEEIFELLEEKITSANNHTGRPGMDLWQILVLGVVRLALDCNYDRIEHVANYDGLVREVMGVPVFGGVEQFHHKTLSENVCHIDDELLGRINEIVVKHGRDCFKKKGNEKIAVKTDSYVLESNVHYPTDVNLLWDAGRKCIELTSRLCESLGLSGWRKVKNWERQLKNAKRACEKTLSGGGAKKEERVKNTVSTYLQIAHELEVKVTGSMLELSVSSLRPLELLRLEELRYFHEMLVKHIDLVDRRLLKHEQIPHHEKIFSLFEPHTELIIKGKVMPPSEFGHRLLLSTDQYGLVLDYKVMEGGSEKEEIVPVAERLLERFGEDSLGSLSTDKGFSSAANREKLGQRIPLVVMPKIGRRSETEKEREREKIWHDLKQKHSAVESDINSLEHHGLNRCPDKGLTGYKRYVGLGILAYNLHRIGRKILEVQRAGENPRRKKVA
jgi:IS5 family transposase